MVAEIVYGKPIPSARRNGAAGKYPWRDLKPGDSFKFEPHVQMNSASSYVSRMSIQWDRKFVVRNTPDGIWCWRVDGLKNPPPNGNFRHEAEIVIGKEIPAEDEI